MWKKIIPQILRISLRNLLTNEILNPNVYKILIFYLKLFILRVHLRFQEFLSNIYHSMLF